MEQTGLCQGARNRLREALLQMLEHTELNKICVTELCRRAEVNRTSFYRYYALPEDVLKEILEELAGELAEVTALPRDGEELERALLQMCRDLYARAPLVRTLIRRSENGGNRGEFRNLLTKQMIGSLPPEHGEESRPMAAAFFAGGLWALLRKWIKEEPMRPPEEVVSMVLMLVSTGRSFAK